MYFKLRECFMQLLWDIMESSNLPITDTNKEKLQVKGIEHIVNELIKKHFPNLGKAVPIQEQEEHAALNRTT